MKKTLLFVLLLLCTRFIFAQSDIWLWAKQAGGTYSDEGNGIAIDSSGNSYVTGRFQGTATFGTTTLTTTGSSEIADIFVAKLDSSGNWLWATKAGGNDRDYGYDIATDFSGNSYVTGYFNGTASFGGTTLTSSGQEDIFVAKLDSSGNWLWAKKAGGTCSESGLSIATDSSGNSYVIGGFWETASFGSMILESNGNADIFVAKLDSSGNWLWAKKAGGTYSDEGWGIAIDSSGNSYVTGYFEGTASFGTTTLTSSEDIDIFIAKLDSGGNWLWAKQAGGSYWDMGYSIAIDSSGNSYVTGNFGETASFGSITLTSSGDSDIFVTKLDSNGNWLWAKQAGGTSSVAYGYSIATDSSGNSYVTGYFGETASFGSITLTSSGDSDIFVTKLDSNGNWLGAIKAGGTQRDIGYGIAIDSSGNSYVTGCFQWISSFGNIILTSSGSFDIFVAKAYIPYDSNDIVVVEGTTGLGAIYPNPFNPVANIPYNLSEISNADFYIYNVKGQLVRHINVGPQHPGYYQISWNGKDANDKSCGSGIYYFIMKAGKQTFQRKAVLLK
ncbi:MAG: SBBP repeat-containing protein [Candidatus Cloacimonetes bacterium]